MWQWILFSMCTAVVAGLVVALVLLPRKYQVPHRPLDSVKVGLTDVQFEFDTPQVDGQTLATYDTLVCPSGVYYLDEELKWQSAPQNKTHPWIEVTHGSMKQSLWRVRNDGTAFCVWNPNQLKTPVKIAHDVVNAGIANVEHRLNAHAATVDHALQLGQDVEWSREQGLRLKRVPHIADGVWSGDTGFVDLPAGSFLIDAAETRWASGVTKQGVHVLTQDAASTIEVTTGPYQCIQLRAHGKI